jgi:hypothetical protein
MLPLKTAWFVEMKPDNSYLGAHVGWKVFFYSSTKRVIREAPRCERGEARHLR